VPPDEYAGAVVGALVASNVVPARHRLLTVFAVIVGLLVPGTAQAQGVSPAMDGGARSLPRTVLQTLDEWLNEAKRETSTREGLPNDFRPLRRDDDDAAQ